MGIEYALVDDTSGEAFELGKGPWGEWEPRRIPTSLEAILDTMPKWHEVHGIDVAYTERLAGQICQFIQTHPNCKLVNDCCGDYFWTDSECELLEARADPPRTWDGIYKTVGSRYVKPPSPAEVN